MRIGDKILFGLMKGLTYVWGLTFAQNYPNAEEDFQYCTNSVPLLAVMDYRKYYRFTWPSWMRLTTGSTFRPQRSVLIQTAMMGSSSHSL